MVAAMNNISEMPRYERPLSEQYRLAAESWVDANMAASLLEELKSATLESIKSEFIKADPKLAENRAERLAKTSPEWKSFIDRMVRSRAAAGRARVRMKEIEMLHSEWLMKNAAARQERKMS
jgi:hypothetical protein